MAVYTCIFGDVITVEPVYATEQGLFCLLDEPDGTELDLIRIPYDVIATHRRGFKDGKSKQKRLQRMFMKKYPLLPKKTKKVVEVPTPEDMEDFIEKARKKQRRLPTRPIE